MLEHLKFHSFHCDLGVGDRFHWFSSAGWMVWNFQVGALLVGATACVFDGSPNYPDNMALFASAAAKATFFGVGSPFLIACHKSGASPSRLFMLELALADRGRLTAAAETYDSVSRTGKRGHLSALPLGARISPQPSLAACRPCRSMRAKCKPHAWVRASRPLMRLGTVSWTEVGELVCTRPMPSMPLYFWGDEGNRRYRE